MYYIPNKLFYMAVPKTGSTAITNHLNKVFDYKGVKCVKTKSEECSHHPTIWDIDRRMAEENFFCTVVRNPYSRFVSHYFYSLHIVECWEKYKCTPSGKKIIDEWNGSMEELAQFKKDKPGRIDLQKNIFLKGPNKYYEGLKSSLSGVNSFKDYVHKFYEEDFYQNGTCKLVHQVVFTHFCWNYDGPKMDFIGKMEDLQGSCDYICKELNIDSKKLPYLNKSKHKHWSEYYDHDTRKIIGLIYDMDFKYFGYEK